MIRYWLAPGLTFERKTAGASGFDLHSDHKKACQIDVGRRLTFRTGLNLEMPLGIEAQVRPRSGLARNHGVVAVGGTIDSDYRGEILITLINFGENPYTVQPGDRIAQLVFAPVVIPGDRLVPWVFIESDDPRSSFRWPDLVRIDSLDELSLTARGTSGHGSTGR